MQGSSANVLTTTLHYFTQTQLQILRIQKLRTHPTKLICVKLYTPTCRPGRAFSLHERYIRALGCIMFKLVMIFKNQNRNKYLPIIL